MRQEIKDVSGEKYNRLTIIETIGIIKVEKERYKRVLCVCDCGVKKEMNYKVIKKGKIKSCGCLSKEIVVDIIKENRYGLLTIIQEVDKYVSPSGNKTRRMLCECICGNRKEYNLNTLRSGDTTDCGCIIKHKLIKELKTTIDELNIKELNEKNILGDWIVLEQISAKRNSERKIERTVYAKCSCGVIEQRKLHNISKSKIKKCTECTRKMTQKIPDDEKEIYKAIVGRLTGIKRRCNNPNSSDYHNYGGRGIKLCEDWHKREIFYSWCINNGFDKSLELDRIDNNGDYCPENCRFVTKKENNRNTRKSVMTWELVNKIRYGEWVELNSTEISKLVGCCRATVDAVRKFETWND